MKIHKQTDSSTQVLLGPHVLSALCVYGEIIRSTWWTSDVVHHSTKKLPPV